MFQYLKELLFSSSELLSLLLLIVWTLIVVGLVLGIKHLILLRPYKKNTDLPHRPDPYQIAFLRSPYDLIRLSVFSLLQQGLLHMSKSRRSVKRTRKIPPSNLHPVDRMVYDHIETAPFVLRLLRNPKLQERLESLFADQTWTMERKQYLLTNNIPYQLLKGGALALVMGLGAFKLATYQFGQGFFTVLLLIILFFVVPMMIKTPRLTPKGEKAIADFTSAYNKAELIDPKDHQSVLLGLSVGTTDLLPSPLKERLALDLKTKPPGSSTDGWYNWSSNISSQTPHF